MVDQGKLVGLISIGDVVKWRCMRSKARPTRYASTSQPLTWIRARYASAATTSSRFSERALGGFGAERDRLIGAVKVE